MSRSTDRRGTELPDSDGGAAAGHPYKERMPPETAALFDRVSSDPDLGYEIKLLRTYISILTDDLKRNGRQILQSIVILIRAVQVRLKQGAGLAEIKQLLRKTGEQVLTEMEKRDE